MRLPKFRCKNNVGNWCFFTVLHNGNVNEENFDLSTLSEFTGLLDKQGAEIYEGDIVRATFGKHSKLNEYGEWTGKIFFNCGSFDVDGEWCVALNALGDTTFEVIGNIYEHSYLRDNQLNKYLDGESQLEKDQQEAYE